jgi:hypothetical protein
VHRRNLTQCTVTVLRPGFKINGKPRATGNAVDKAVLPYSRLLPPVAHLLATAGHKFAVSTAVG